MLKLQNSYAHLPENFFHKVNPVSWCAPKLIFYNEKLSDKLNIELGTFDRASILSGQQTFPSSQPIAMAYAGHQFGHYVPQLGDGRAVLIGEVQTQSDRFDIHLKGSGPTKYSRRGDGRCELGAALREYLVSEAMDSLHIPTTRSLALNLTGEMIQRDHLRPGAVLARVAKSHIRVGTFEYFFYQNDFKSLKILADYCIERLYPTLKGEKNRYLDFFRAVAIKQLKLISNWQSIGFIHGVMNTDNCAISGETIDYGPCAFIDHFRFDKVFSSIDRQGRYAYNNQDKIILWNLSAFAQTLIPLVHSDHNQSINLLEEVLTELPKIQLDIWVEQFAKKLGIIASKASDQKLIIDFLNYLQKNQLDFTNSFRELPSKLESIHYESYPIDESKCLPDIYHKIYQRIKIYPFDECVALMNKVNPYVIARNHQIEKAIQQAYQGDYCHANRLLKALGNPFETNLKFADLTHPPRPEEEVCQTFCGT